MNIKYNKALWLIIILAIVIMIPFLGLTDFNTKGEPREAVVAYTMLEHGNWSKPVQQRLILIFSSAQAFLIWNKNTIKSV